VDFLFVRAPSPFLLPLLQTNDPASEQNASLSDGKTVRVGFNRLTDIKLQDCHRSNQNRPDQSRPDRRLLQKLGGNRVPSKNICAARKNKAKQRQSIPHLDLQHRRSIQIESRENNLSYTSIPNGKEQEDETNLSNISISN
jgi:hypothetical protein